MKDPNAKAKDKEDKMAAGADADPNVVAGTLVVKCVHARELSGDCTPDPYVAFTFPGGLERKTPVVSSTANPVWNEVVRERVRMPRDAPVPLKAFVKDSNYISRDAVIGFTDVNWSA